MGKYLDITEEKFPKKMEDTVSYFFLKTYLFLESKYFAAFPEHLDKSKEAFGPFYQRYKEFETHNIKKRNDILNALSTEIHEYPERSYDEFLREFKAG
jgi:hypothetical protein